MRIQSLHIRHFRSVEGTGLTQCGGLNVLIGKNNAGKSNVLSAIDLALSHLKTGHISGPWHQSRRPLDEFTDRDSDRRMQIGIEFELSETTNDALREALLRETTQFERAIDQIKNQTAISFVVSGAIERNSPYLFVEAIAAGRLNAEGPFLCTDGIRLLEVSETVGRDLYVNEREAAEYRSDLSTLDRLSSDALEYAFREASASRIYGISRIVGDSLRPGTLRRVETAFKSASDSEEFLRGVAPLLTELRDNIREIEQRETSAALGTFIGDARTPPAYAGWLMQEFGSIPMIHFRETKQPIGPEEAAALLRLKVRRGGEERLSAVKQTVRALLGVSVDAFEPDDGASDRRPVARVARRIAEMDINDFVVEANGAGIREALRIVLDLELKDPHLVLIEEPEVHLHPGLEQALHSYLVGKSSEVQLFVTTHSTNFVDAASLQNVYLVSRDADKKTIVETVVPEDGAFRIPSELGLRLSTVFMYDRLVFVEGRSDEDVLRELAKQLGIDLTRANVGFVQMGGVRNFTHFAAEGTLELLSRRRIKMWFITDRDENTDDDVQRMLARLGTRARLAVLKRRELENYLLNPDAVSSFIREKLSASSDRHTPSVDEIRTALSEEADALKPHVTRLRLERSLLRPIYLQSRTADGSPQDRLRAAVTDLTNRIESMETVAEELAVQTDADWPNNALNLASGSLVLDNVARRYALRYVKEVDGIRLARKHQAQDIPVELRLLLTEIANEASA